MADNYDNDDEYEFVDLDTMGPEVLGPEESINAPESTLSAKRADLSRNNIKRNALIAIGFIILLMLAYKFLGSFFSRKPDSTVAPLTTAVKEPVQPAPVTPVVVKPIEPPPTVTATPVPTVSTEAEQQLSQKLSSLETNQDSVRSQVSNVSEQMNGVSNNINDLNNKLNSLTQMIGELTQKLDEQTTQIALLKACNQPKKIIHRTVRPIVHRTVYYIQAVIPGRAWLIATNGSTLTVREGTNIPGYGIVKLIDPHQGKVLTSSGQVIRFSPQDS